MLLLNKDIKESPTLKINASANQKKKRGEAVYNFSIGEPVVDNSEFIVRGVVDALAKSRTAYPPTAGLSELLNLAADWMDKKYHSHYDQREVMATCGGKYGLSLALQALLDKGDEVIVISPYWVSYPEMIKIFGGTAKICQTEEINGWQVDLEKLSGLFSEKTKAIIINNASNPTGHLFSREELSGILKLAHDRGVFVISDEVYSGLVYDDNIFISSGEFTEYKDKIIIIQSCSKNFGMTGWRVGLIFGPKEVIDCLTVLQGQSITNTSIVSQWAAIAAFQQAEAITSEIRKAMQARRDLFVKTFNDLFPGKIKAPASSLYCLVKLSDLGEIKMSADDLALELIEKANVAVTPGGGFGTDGYLRFSFGIEEKEIEAGLKAINQYLK